MQSIMKPRLVILDADAVIHLCELGKWDALVRAYEVVLPETVAYSECRYFEKEDGSRVRIRIREMAETGILRVESASHSEVVDIRNRLGKTFNAFHDIHIGEIEAMVVLENEPEGSVICTGDTAAVKALCFLNHSSRLVSVESLLCMCGHTVGVEWNFTEKALKEKIAKGQGFRIQYGSDLL